MARLSHYKIRVILQYHMLGGWYDEKVMTTKKLNLSLFPLVLIVALIGCGGDKNSESAPVDGNGTGATEAKGSENKETTLAEYLPGKRFLLEMTEQMKEAAAKRQNNTCKSNMRTLELAVLEWALEKRKADTSEVTLEELAPFLKDGIPKCPAGGQYILTADTKKLKCSYGHTLDFKKGDKVPPYNGPEIRVFIQFNENGTTQLGGLKEMGERDGPSPSINYEVSSPMELTMKYEGANRGKVVFTNINPTRGDVFKMLVGPEESEVFLNAPITEVVPASPLKEPEIEPESEPPGEGPSEF